MTTTSSKIDGFLLENNGNATLVDCRVENNTFNTTAEYNLDLKHVYGAISNRGLLSIVNSTFINNVVGYAIITDKDDEYSYDYGKDMGEASCIYNEGLLNISDSLFKDNYAGRHAGSIYSTNNTNIIRTEFINNTATRCGGALVLQNGTYSIDQTKFINNTILVSVNIGTGNGWYAGNAIYVGVINSQVERGYTNNITINNSYFEENKLKQIASSGYSSKYDSIIHCFENNGELNIDNTNFKNHESNLLSGGNNEYIQSITNSQVINFTNAPFQSGNFEKLVNNTYINTSFPTASATIIENNTYHNMKNMQDTIELNILQKIYTGEPLTITGTYNTPYDTYDPELYKQNQFQVYLNGELYQTLDTLEFTITPTSSNMILTVQPTISQTRKSVIIRPITINFTLDDVTATIGETTQITAQITATTDGENMEVNTGRVYFKVNGKILRDTTNGRIIYADVSDNSATLDYNVPKTWNEDTTIEAVYTGGEELPQVTSNMVTPTIATPEAQETEFAVEEATATAGSEVIITVTTKNLDSGKVVLKVNGKTVKAVDGKLYTKVEGDSVTFTYIVPKTLKAGDYTIKAVYTSGAMKLEADANLVVV